MLLDDEGCYDAMQARDARFDGRFFVGVSSTGIYCRPVCAVRLPRRENCSFFPSAAAAEALGYRPCLRCRPELAPGFAVIDAPAAIARRAASLIEDGSLGEEGLGGLARRVGVTDRHLRRVFATHFGVSPVQYAQTQRLLLAKRLLTDTAMPVTEVAMASGFSSLRRFNALFAQRYRLPPSRLRAQAPRDRVDSAMRFELAYRPPLDWDRLLAFLSDRVVAGVETVTAHGYRRVVALAAGERTHTGWIEVRHRPARRTLEVLVSPQLGRVVPQVLARVKRLFDTDCRPDEVARVLGALAEQAPGLRVPGAFDGFELAVRAILGQQVSVRAAHTLAGRFAQRFGQPVDTGVRGLHHAFPTAGTLAGCGVDEVAGLGVIAQRARAIIGLAKAVAQGGLRLESGADVQREVDALNEIAGIGDWTAQYIAMRALGWPDAFPAADLVVMRALAVKTAAQARAAAAHWRPWRAYAVMQLWRAQAQARPSAGPERRDPSA
jgi:AraC family transcriptional regulator of adaptative response / DNA-3-methyladenine glycosylase II